MAIGEELIATIKTNLNNQLKQTGTDAVQGNLVIDQELAKYKGIVSDAVLQEIGISAKAQNAAAIASLQSTPDQEVATKQESMKKTVMWVGGASLLIVGFLIYKSVKS